MTPKGGIRPHNRFSIKATRSEVLFVDYIAEHLNVNGRAGVIVPEGIIFQSQNAYKKLRKMLVENYLWCVVSLPAGCFNPYSGVKTSILFLDKSFAKRTDEILFVKVENDGFDLGAQRRPIEKNDLPEALTVISRCHSGLDPESRVFPDSQVKPGNDKSPLAHSVPRKRILESSDCNLSGDRYRDNGLRVSTKWPMVRLGDKNYFQIESGGTPDSENPEYWDGNICWATLIDLPQDDLITELADTQRRITEKGLKNSSAVVLPPRSVLVSSRATIGRIAVTRVATATNQGFKNIVIKDFSEANERYVAYSVIQLVPEMLLMASGGTFKEISRTNFSNLKIPLPPLEVQKKIVAELDGYQKIIEGAKQIISNYKPIIRIDPEWPMVELGQTCKNLDGKRIPIEKGQRKSGKYPYYGASGIVDYVDEYIFDGDYLLLSEDGANLLARTTPIAFSVSGKVWVNNHAHVLQFDDSATQHFAEVYVNSMDIKDFVTGAAQPKLSQANMNRIPIPLPPLDVQRRVVGEIDAERELVEANHKLIKIYEQKIQTKLAEIWGEK
jgi:type I restriction enzyme M protein